MSIEKIGPNKWRIKVCVRVPNKDNPVKKQETFKGTKTEADIRKSEIIKEIRSKKQASRSLKLTNFGAALDIYADKKNKKSAPDISRIKKLKNDLGDISLAQFADRFEIYLQELKITPTYRGNLPTGATINRIIEIVRAVFNLLAALDLIHKNPITKARFPKAIQKPRDRFLTEEECLRLLNAIRKHRPYLLPFVEYNLSVPCRKGELINARREQYNQVSNTIYIPDSKAGIPIHKPVPDHLKEYFRNIPANCPYLFYRQDPEGTFYPLGDCRKAWKFCLEKAGLKNVRIHDLRHISATKLYEAGNPERVIMDIAGWQTPMLSTYRHKDSFKSAKSIRFNASHETVKNSNLVSSN